MAPTDRFEQAARMRSLESDQCASASRFARRCRPRLDRPDRYHRNGAASVEARPLEPFPIPIPVRTLDAIHLAAIEFIRSQGASVQLSSYDERLVGAARLLGNCRVERKLNTSTTERDTKQVDDLGVSEAADIEFIDDNALAIDWISTPLAHARLRRYGTSRSLLFRWRRLFQPETAPSARSQEASKNYGCN
jgi:hypothetical protein